MPGLLGRSEGVTRGPATDGCRGSPRGHRGPGLSRRRLAGAAGPAALAVLAACGLGGPDGTSEAGGGVRSAAPVAYRDFTYWTEGRRPDMLKKMKELIEARLPGVTYTLEFMASGNYTEAVTAQFAGGTPPDFLFLGTPVAHTFADRGDLLDLGPYASRSRLRWEDFVAVGDSFKTRKGRTVGLPFVAFASALFSNKSAWEQARLPGTPASWTWDDLLAWGKQATADENRDGLADRYLIQSFAERNDVMLWAPFVYGNGGRVISPDGKRSTVAEPAAVEAFEFLADLALKHGVAPKRDDYPALGVRGYGDLFNARRAILSPTDSGSFAGFNQRAEANGFVWDVALFPKAKRTGKTAVMVGASPYCLSAKAAQPDRAWEVLRFMGGFDVQTLLGVYQVTQPGLKAAWNDPNGWLKAPPEGTKAYNEHLLRDGVPRPAWEGANDYLKAVHDNLQPGFDGTLAMRSACEAAAAAADQVLRQQAAG
jgi:multiple sugar transport system substrate-binding protein